MPTYDYECRKCGHRFELFHSMSDESIKRCPKCRGRARRVPSAGAGLLFKGSGFYITDYRSASYQEKAKQEKSSGGAGDAGGGSEAKPAPSAAGDSAGKGSPAGGSSSKAPSSDASPKPKKRAGRE